MKYFIFIISWLLFQQSHAETTFNQHEINKIKSFGPWPMAFKKDLSNRFSGNPQAIALGKQLFNDKRYSRNGDISCAHCHQENKQFTDQKALSSGLEKLNRNTPSLLNLNHSRWFAWDGRSDSLWAQSLLPFLNEKEMGLSINDLKAITLLNSTYVKQYQTITENTLSDENPETVAVNLSKFIAAFQEQFVSPVTPFDQFVSHLTNNKSTDNLLTDKQQEGLKIFIGKGNCMTCHFGNTFTNNEFGDIGISYFTKEGVDAGRYSGIQKLLASQYNLSSKFNDHAQKTNYPKVRRLQRNFGEFKVPSLRGIAQTHPYMHNGSLKTLNDVVDHYSELNEERLHSDGIKILKPLNLKPSEKEALVSFLEIL